MLTVRVKINIASQTTPQIIPVVQGDTGRSVLFEIADFVIPASATATYYIKKPSGQAVYNAATIDGNTVLADLTAQSIAEVGENPGQVRILKNDEVVTSFDFILDVEPFRGIDAIESTTEMNVFDQAVQQALEEIDGSLDSIVADEFSTSDSYLEGEYVLKDGALYRFTSNHAAGAWSTSDTEAVTIGEALTELAEGGGGGGAVNSVNGKTGTVVLDAGDLEYDDKETYSSDTVGKALTDLKGDLNGKIDAPSTAGTSGQVLATDGDGGTYWTNSGGGGSSPSPYTSNPSALGTASAGSSDAYARGDHVHPKPTASDLGITVPSASSATPQALGSASAGSSSDYSRADHVHAMPTAATVGAIALPSNPSTNDFLVFNGSAWVAQSLSTWQGGSY